MPLRTIAQYPVDEALALLDTDKDHIVLHGYRVKTRSQRYDLFRENISCVMCGALGRIMSLQTFSNDKKVAHFNLFKDENEDVLFSKDHIMPKSKGGPNKMWNYQTMCQHCQLTKAAGLPAGSRFFHQHERYTMEEIAVEEFLASKFGKDLNEENNGNLEERPECTTGHP